MVAILSVVLCVLFGYALARRLPLAWYGPERVAAGVVLAALGGGWMFLLCSLLMPYVLAVPLAFASLSVACYLLLKGGRSESLTLDVNGWFLWWLTTVVSGVGLSWLFWTHMLMVSHGALYTAGGAWGDMALHARLITHFANQGRFDFSFPLLVGGKLTYPFLIDFLSGLLYRDGWSLQMSLIVPGLALALALVQLTFFLGLRWFKNAWAGFLAVFLFLLNGSFGGLTYAWLDFRAGGLGILAFLNAQPHEYSQITDTSLQYTNLVSGALLPQRSILIGFGILLLLLLFMYEAWHRERARILPVVSGAMLGILPFAHPHSYLAGMLLLLLATGAALVTRRQDRWYWVAGLGLAVAVALPQGIWQLRAMPHAAGYSRFYLGWVRKPGDGLVRFWFRTLGLELPVILLLPVLLWKLTRSRFVGLLGVGLLALFCILGVYLFQPYDYDNIKLLYVVHLGSSLAAAGLLAWVGRKKLGWLVVVPAFALLTACGILAVWQQATVSWQFMSVSDIAFAADFSRAVPKDALVLTSDQHNHPVPVLTGRSIVLGYRGWLWSYGIMYRPVEADVSAMFLGGPTSEFLVKKYGISYIVVGPSELANWNANQAYFTNRYPTVLDEYGWRVYKVN